MTRPVFITWLWNARGGWRTNAGYTPEIIAGVQHMLAMAVPGCRHVCIADLEYHAELERRSVEPFPLWEVYGGADRLSRYGFDCHARHGLYGEPGARLRKILSGDTVQWIDADVMVKRTAGAVLTQDWDAWPEMYWVPRNPGELEKNFTFGQNQGTWLGLNGSMVRMQLGSRPDWWEKLGNAAWVAETEARICGSDQAALTRLVLEEMGEDWREPNRAIFSVPRFGDKVIPYGNPGQWEVAFFPYEPFTPSGRPSDYTKPWLTNNAYLRRQWRVLAGMATEAEERAEANPVMMRKLRRY